MSQVLLICFREGLESFLVIALAIIFLRNANQPRLVGAVRWGLVVSLLGSAALGVVFSRIGALSPVWAGFLALVAAAAVFACVFSLFKAGPQMAEDIKQRMNAALARKEGTVWWGVFGLTILLVGREGVEAATMIASLAASADARTMAIGGVLGLALAGGVSALWVRFGKRVNLQRFFKVTSWFMLAFAVQLVLYASHEFSEAGVLPLVDNAAWHIATEDVAEGWISQLMAIAMVAVPTLWLLYAGMADRKKVAAKRTASG